MIRGNRERVRDTENEIIVNNYHSVEMKPAKALPIYQFKLHQIENMNGACVLIKKESEILSFLKPGKKIEMKYHPKKKTKPAACFNTQILDITKSEKGPFRGYFQVSLSVVD